MHGKEGRVKKLSVTATVGRAAPRARIRTLDPEERYDANIDYILHAAAAVFAEKSFGLASIRDIAAHARISFPRIYYYLRNKEELLYLISKRAFEGLLTRAEEKIAAVSDPEEKLRLFIAGHLEFQLENLAEMKVLVREADSLSGRYATQIERLKRDYSRLCRRTIEQVAVKYARNLDRNTSRILTSLLFGAMNSFHAWYEPSRDSENLDRIVDEVYRMVSATLIARQA